MIRYRQGGVIDEDEDSVTEKLNAAIKATAGKSHIALPSDIS